MKRLGQVLIVFFLSFLPFLVAAKTSYAADIRSNETVTVDQTSQNLSNLYLFGSTVTLQAPVQNDVVAAGRNLNLDGPITGSLMAAGANITIKNTIGNSIRVAGGDITIIGPVTHDIVAAGGTITTDKNASVGGDLVFAGGKLVIDGPVKGNLRVAGGKVLLNSTVGGDVHGDIRELTLGPNAVIHGSLNYKAEQKATIDPQAKVAGKVTFNQKKNIHQNTSRGVFAGGLLYKLILDIILSVLFIYFFSTFGMETITLMNKNAVKNAVNGFIFLLLFPLAAIILLILIWPGIAAFLLYALTMIVALFLAKIFAGWKIMSWYEARSDKKHVYLLDWKAGIVGPIVLAVLLLIPIIGWLAAAILFLIATGALVQYVLVRFQKGGAEAGSGKEKSK